MRKNLSLSVAVSPPEQTRLFTVFVYYHWRRTHLFLLVATSTKSIAPGFLGTRTARTRTTEFAVAPDASFAAFMFFDRWTRLPLSIHSIRNRHSRRQCGII